MQGDNCLGPAGVGVLAEPLSKMTDMRILKMVSEVQCELGRKDYGRG